jgi:P2-related tail formation protein
MKVVESSSDCSDDLIPPVISINGDNPTSIFVGETYSDVGATALDDKDGDVTGRITTTGTVNPSVPGSYTITYRVSDNAGNEATAERTINVIDNIEPVITLNPTGYEVYAKTRSINVTVTDEGNINLDSLKYIWTTSIEEPLISDFVSPFTNEDNINSPVGVSGSYYLWVCASDDNDNIAISRSEVVNLDNIGPVITITGDNPVTINRGSTYSDAGATASDAHSGVSGSVSSTGTVNPSVVGSYTITYNVSDNVGNAAISVIRTINVVDAEAPVITILGNNPVSINVGSIYNDDGATALDDVDGDVTDYIITTGTVNPNIPGSYTITYTVEDSAGNEAIASRTVNVIDNVLPTVAFSMNGNATWAKTRSTTVTVSDAHSSINTSSLMYQWTTSTTTPTEASFGASFTNGSLINSPAGVTGGYYLWILGKDTANNTMINRSNVFNLDNTIPVITVTGTNPITINMGSSYTDAGATASDSHSGVGSVTATGTVNPSVAGSYTINYNVSDNAGNAATPKTRTVNVVDKTALNAAISSANTNKASVTISENGIGLVHPAQWVTQAEANAYQTAISAAQAVYNNANATQIQINSAVSALATATTTFNNAKKYPPTYTTTQFTTVGTINWTVPAGVTSINAVLVGGGGGGRIFSGTYHAGGGGGGLRTITNLPVTAGETLSIVVGAGGNGGSNPGNGASSSIMRGTTTLVYAGGGTNGYHNGNQGGPGGTGTAFGTGPSGGTIAGGDGGAGGTTTSSYSAGGGGAGGYSGTGGRGAGGSSGGISGAGGGGAGGSASSGGGGVGILGEGTSGSYPNGGGSGGINGKSSASYNGGDYGGGGAGREAASTSSYCYGAQGAIAISYWAP